MLSQSKDLAPIYRGSLSTLPCMIEENLAASLSLPAANAQIKQLRKDHLPIRK